MLTAALVTQIYSLIHFVEKTRYDINRFLEAIQHEDFSQVFRIRGLGDSYEELYQSFNGVLKKFQDTRAETEANFRYLQTIVQHIGVGLIVFDHSGKLDLVNNAAKRLLHVIRLNNLSDLSARSAELADTLAGMKTSENRLFKIRDGDEEYHLMVYTTGFILRDRRYTMASFQNIQSELEEKEMEAWQNLIRVLTHEIMNSITPIASLASTANNLLVNYENRRQTNALSSELVEDIRSAVETIEKRSRGLHHFVQSYRQLTHLPRPNYQIFTVSELFSRIERMMKPLITEMSIDFHSSINPRTLELTADQDLIEQVLINLINNAYQAVNGNVGARIELLANQDERDRVLIEVSDNGPGIPEEAREKIFIPFFTTRPKGSGIGLSLARQIMRIHHGTISMRTNPHVHTVFTLRF